MLVDDLAQAIARYEGFYTAGTLAQRNNNPGNLRSWGSYPVVNGYVQFPDAASGWAALRAQVSKNIGRGLNLYEFFGGKPGTYAGYSPSSDGNSPSRYAETVATWLGIRPDKVLSAVNPSAALAVTEPWTAPSTWLTLPEIPELAAVPDWIPYAAAAIAAISLIVLVSEP